MAGRGAGVYIGITARAKVYVGQSGNIAERFFGPRGHVVLGKFTTWGARLAIRIPVKGPQAAREVVEQRILDRLGGKMKSWIENKKNPIGPKRQDLLDKDPRRWHKLW